MNIILLIIYIVYKIINKRDDKECVFNNEAFRIYSGSFSKRKYLYFHYSLIIYIVIFYWHKKKHKTVSLYKNLKDNCDAYLCIKRGIIMYTAPLFKVFGSLFNDQLYKGYINLKCGIYFLVICIFFKTVFDIV